MVTSLLPHPHLTTTEERIMFMLIMAHPNNVQVRATGYAAAGQSSPSLGNIVKPRISVYLEMKVLNIYET